MLMSLTSWILATFLIIDPMYFGSKWCPGSQLPKIVVSYRICFRWFQAFYFFPLQKWIFFHTFSGTLGYQKKYKWQKNRKISGIIQNLFQVISSILFFPYKSRIFSTLELFLVLWGTRKKYKWWKFMHCWFSPHPGTGPVWTVYRISVCLIAWSGGLVIIRWTSYWVIFNCCCVSHTMFITQGIGHNPRYLALW